MEEKCRFTSRLPIEKNEGWQSLSQRQLLMDLFKIPFIANNFWLAGGTCLSAMYLGHRQSEDLDLFTTLKTIHPSERETIVDILPDVLGQKRELGFSTEINSIFASLIINNTKVDFVADRFAYECERPTILLDNVACKIDSWDNLCVAKFSAFLSRTSDKDISDIGAILKTANNDMEFKQITDFLICETRKRDAMADELSQVADIILYASEKSESQPYKDILIKFAETVIGFTKEIAEGFEMP